MYKLQVILLSPITESAVSFLGIPSITPDKTQLSTQTHLQPTTSSTVLGGRHEFLPMGANTSINSMCISSYLGSHIGRPRLKKFLHFTKPTNTLYQLADEIVEKCNKMYPGLLEDPQVTTLQDINECDLDPDFIVKDVFNVDNTVRVVLKNDLEVATGKEVSTLYMAKKRKLNSGVALSATAPVVSVSNPILNVSKKRTATIKNSALRISTPLANQIYPLTGNKQVNSDYEDDEVGDKSILPPPPPQSPPIRISSSMDRKKLRLNENAVSRSEMVDPNKSKQQRLPSGTPMKASNIMIETPNRLGIAGPTVLTETNTSFSKSTTTPVATNSRITSGMLQIPEPRISEVEKELGEGPASSTVDSPAKPARIPIKKPYKQIIQHEELDDSSSESESNVVNPVPRSPRSRNSINVDENSEFQTVRIQSSFKIADGDESPTKKSSVDNNKVVEMEELPSPHKSFLEKKVDRLSTRKSSDESLAPATRKNNFSDEDSETSQNGSVVVNRPETQGEKSFQKSDLLKIFNNKRFELPPQLKSVADEDGTHVRSRKPYLTVLNKDIDNSVPDPRNILPRRTQRHAAQKAAKFISTGTSRKELESECADDKPIEPITGSDSVTDESEGVFLEENNASKKLNIHQLKESVVMAEKVAISASTEKDISKNDFNIVPVITPTLLSSKLPDKQEIASLKLTVSSTSSQENPILNSEKEVESTKITSSEGKKVVMSPPEHTIIALNKAISSNIKSSGSITEKILDTPNEGKNGKSRDSRSESKTRNKPANSDGNFSNAPSVSPVEVNQKNAQNKKFDQDKSISLKAIGKKKVTRKAQPASKRTSSLATRRSSLPTTKSKVYQTPEFLENSSDETTYLAKPMKSLDFNSDLAASKSSFDVSTNNRPLVRPSMPEIENVVVTDHESEKAGKEALNRAVAAASKMVTEKLAQSQNELDLFLPDKVSKLDLLRSKFSKNDKDTSLVSSSQQKQTSSTIQKLARNSIRKDAELSSENSSDQSSDQSSENSSNESSEEDSSSEGESTSSGKKSRRGIVKPPKGPVSVIKTNKLDLEPLSLEKLPQSSQSPKKSDLISSGNAPLTKFMEQMDTSMSPKLSSPEETTTKSASKKLLNNHSLSSLSDLASRGVPEVRDKSSELKFQDKITKYSSEDTQDEGSDESSSESDSDSSESSSDATTSTIDNNYISAKIASKALGKKKFNSGFASLIKDSQKK